MDLRVPQTIRQEHEKLHGELEAAVKAGGRTGEAARAVMKIVKVLSAREEEHVAPALALLGPASAGELTPEMATFLPRIALLRSQLPQMLREHVEMVEALRGLLQAAMEERLTGFARVAQRLIAHAQEEEEILYPAALLVGDALKARFASA